MKDWQRKIRYISVWTILLLISSLAKGQTKKYIEYANNNKMVMKLDSVTIKDKDFRLHIPYGLLASQNTVSNYFLHTLSFDGGQKILLLYFPNTEGSPDYRSFGLTHKAFEKLCEKGNIEDELGDIKLSKKRRFGLIRLNGGSFYAIYLNVLAKNVNAFNHSISSIQF